jgi:Acyl-CoA synthetases (AMP-forming)/AMP-acid ligases II
MANSFPYPELLQDYWGAVKKTIDKFGRKDFIVTTGGNLSFSATISFAEHIYDTVLGTGLGNSYGIGIYLEDPRKFVPSSVGTILSGNYYIALDINFSDSVIQQIAEDAEIKLVLTDKEHIEKIRAILPADKVFLDVDQIDRTLVKEIYSISYRPDKIVHLMFTSGSTGKPKGVIEDYRYMVRASINKALSLERLDQDRILQLASFNYSGHHSTVFAALLCGATICYYNFKQEGMLGIKEFINSQAVTIYSSTPTIFRSFIEILKPDDKMPSVQSLFLGGEKRLKDDFEAIRTHFPNAKTIRLGYAGTEMGSISTTLFPIEKIINEEKLTNGVPHPDLKVFIWDENGHSLPRGEEGEIVIYGSSLARGYLHDEKRTKEKFIPDGTNADYQYFRTSDLGKLDENGHLIFIGRMDNMVKINGIRIELDAIENCIASYPTIAKVASKVYDDANGKKKLASYFVAENNMQIAVPDLRQYLSEHFPVSMIPNQLIQMKEFPVTGSGKVAINLLPTPSTVRLPIQTPVIEPANEIEAQLRSIWEDNLGISGIGVMDDYFDIGGDSLGGVVLLATIEEVFGQNFPVSTLLVANTIRKQADLIKNGETLLYHLGYITIRETGEKPPLFFIPGKGGFPTRIRHLINRIDSQIPIFALQDIESSHPDKKTRTIEQIANLYLSTVFSIRPEGPYIFVGESLGGKIAYEMARILTADRKPEPLVVLLDTYASGANAGGQTYPRNKKQYYKMIVQKHFNIWFRSNWQGKKEYLRFYLENFQQRVSHSKLLGKVKDKESRVTANKRIRVMEVQEMAPYSGQVILIKATLGPAANSIANGWDQVQVGELLIEKLECFHGSILFEPAVSNLGRILQKYIDRFVDKYQHN